jgi:ABC-type amino acid transport substrate-binding protein
MSEEWLAPRLRDLDRPEDPDPAFVDRLYRELADELGFARTAPDGALPGRPIPIAGKRRRSWPLLAVAALLLTLGLGALFASGGGPERPKDDLLAQLRATGRIRVAVSRERPQAVGAMGVVAGFDVEVARAVAAALSLTPELDPVEPPALLDPGGAWDIAMTASALTSEDEAGLALIMPVYHWPTFALVPEDSRLIDHGSLAGHRVGVVVGSAGGRVLPDSASLVDMTSDLDCLERLHAGEVDACLTSSMGPADIATRPGVRSLAGPVMVEPRGPVVRLDGPDPTRLADETRAAITQMRTDGTLADLSRRYLGADLTDPPKDS